MTRRVALVTTSYPRYPGDPAGHFVETEAHALAQEGARVVTWAPGSAGVEDGNPQVRWIDDGDCFGFPGALSRLRARPSRAFGAVRFVHAARAALRQHGPFDLVVAHFIVPCGFPIAHGVAAPLEVVAHGSDVELLVRLGLARRIVTALLARGARFRFVSERLRRELALHSSEALLERSYVAPSPIDVSGAPARGTARDRFGIADGEHLVVVCGRLIAQKRIAAAIGHVVNNELGTRIVIIGDGPDRARLEKSFPRCRFVGHLPRPDALAWIAASDLLVSASRREGAPTVIREARALGVPVLAENCGDLAEWAAKDPGIRLLS